ncbi:hypothetical protein J3F84DRAFT_381502 [Trichoderma pleuroticola]
MSSVMPASHFEWHKGRGEAGGGKEKIRQEMRQNETVDRTLRIRGSETDNDQRDNDPQDVRSRRRSALDQPDDQKNSERTSSLNTIQLDISQIFVNYLRNSHKLSCSICQVDFRPPTLDGFKRHMQSSEEHHPTEEKAILDTFQQMRLTKSKLQPRPTSTTDDQQHPEYHLLNAEESSDSERGNKKIYSPSSSPPPFPGRGRGRQQADNIKEFDRGSKGSSTRRLWSPSSAVLPKSSQSKAQPPGNRLRSRSRAKIIQHEVEEPEADDSYTEDPSITQLIRQPETRPISQEQLVAEVKAIYAGLVMVERKCIEVDNDQLANKDSPQQLNNGQRQALINLHRTLLDEESDAFLPSRHPSTKSDLRRQLLKDKYQPRNLQQYAERLIAKEEERQSKPSELLAAIVKRIDDLTVLIKRKHTKDFSSGDKDFYVGGSVNGTVVEALADTGAEANFISPHLTSRLGLHVIPGLQKWITLANKKVVKPPGMVTVPWKFSKEQITHTINCWILPGCISDLVLGNDFVKATKALEKVCHRIKSKVLGASKRLSLSYLGNEKQRLRGYLNGHLTAALPDTGSDAMLINGAYARKIGLEIDNDIENQCAIRLADGSTAPISGIIRDVEWRVGSTTVQCNFYVLENMCVDIILSNQYLFEMNIFSEQEEHFFDIHSEDASTDQPFDFCILSLDVKKDGASSKDCILTLQALKELEKREELYRRDKIRDEIMELPEDQREAATQTENARQQLWEAQKSEREAKWITEMRMAAANVQNSGSWRSRWKTRISIGFFDKGVKTLTRTRPP